MMTFDPLALTYDTDFTHSPVARYLRARVHQRLDSHFKHNDSILEFGCGTGEDALHLAQRGIHVTATDASEKMLWLTANKTEHTGRVTTKLLDIAQLPAITPVYDGVFSNFGAINILTDWNPLARWLKDRVKPGGIAAFGVMSPSCLWEIAWHGAHGDFKTAFRRQRRTTTFQASVFSQPIRICYPSVAQLELAFAPHFKRVHVEPLGLFLPPSDVYGVIEKRPQLFKRLMWLEERLGRFGLFANVADHYWIEFKRL